MSLTGDKARLTNLTKDLMRAWAEAKEGWRDQRSVEFERVYLHELIQSVDAAVIATDQLEVLLKKIRSDCE